MPTFVRKIDIYRESIASHLFGAINGDSGESEATYEVRTNNFLIDSTIRELWRTDKENYTPECIKEFRDKANKSNIFVVDCILINKDLVAGWCATRQDNTIAIGLTEIDAIIRALDKSIVLPSYLEGYVC